LCQDYAASPSHRRPHGPSDPPRSPGARPELWRSVPRKRRPMQERQDLRTAASAVFFPPMKTCPPSITRSDSSTGKSVCGERIRFGEEGAGNGQRLRPETARKKRKPRAEPTGKTLVRRCASRGRPGGRSRTSSGDPSHHHQAVFHVVAGLQGVIPEVECLGYVAAKTDQQKQKRTELKKLSPHCRFGTSHIPRAEGDAPPNDTRCLPWKMLRWQPKRAPGSSPNRVVRWQLAGSRLAWAIVRLPYPTKKPVAATPSPSTPIRSPVCQKIRRPERSVMEVTTKPISRKTSPRS
jgi:hypothetical protein